ncbi:MAG: hypothetical protein KBD00_03810 [Candidatus Peribacteraceae bacterium]|nr:hypothetical protein [Candidatus Peribacteraceae bacterium]
MASKRDFLVRISLLSVAGVLGVGVMIVLIALFVTSNFQPAQDSLANHIPADSTVFFLRTRNKAQMENISAQVTRMIGMENRPSTPANTPVSDALYEFAIVKTNSGKTLSWISDIQKDSEEGAPSASPIIAVSDEYMTELLRQNETNGGKTFSKESAYDPFKRDFENTLWLMKTDSLVSTPDTASLLLSSLLKQFSWFAMVTAENHGQFRLMDPDLQKLPDQADGFPAQLGYVVRNPLLLMRINRGDAIREILDGALSDHEPLSAGISGILTARMQTMLGSHVTFDLLEPLLTNPFSLQMGSGSGALSFGMLATATEEQQQELLQAIKQDAPTGLIRHLDFTDNTRNDIVPTSADQEQKKLKNWTLQTFAAGDVRGPVTVGLSDNHIILSTSEALAQAMIQNDWAGSTPLIQTTGTPLMGGLLDTSFLQKSVQTHFPFLFDTGEKETWLSFILGPIARLQTILWSVESAEGGIIIDWRQNSQAHVDASPL